MMTPRVLGVIIAYMSILWRRAIMRTLSLTVAVLALWLTQSKSAETKPPQEIRRPYSTLEDSTVRLIPSGASFKIPQNWVGMYRTDRNNAFFSPEELERARVGIGEWNRQYAEVINGTLPFENCSAQAGANRWENSPGVGIHMRAYVGKWSVEEVTKRVAGLGTAQVVNLDKNVSKVTFERITQGDWQVSTLTFYLSFGDYGGTARIDFFAHSFDKQTVVLVFMSIENDDTDKAQIQQIVNSFDWRQGE
jgi:hypothetical protein